MLSNNFVEGLKNQPETYKTILKDFYDNKNTVTNVVRKKLGKMVKFRLITYGILDGTRFGERIFYTLDKLYYIFIICDKTFYGYYYCFDVYDLDDNSIMLVNAYKLKDSEWDKIGDVKISKSCIRRWF